MNNETATLLDYLRTQRRHVIGIVEDLPEENLRAPVLPSGWSCLGLVKHLAQDVEHYWFRCIVAGESLEYFADGAPGGGDNWQLGPGDTAESVFALYRGAAAASDLVVERLDPTTEPAQHDPHWGEWRLPDLRSVILHVIAETACHAGHLDAARELIDGRQRLVV